MFSKIALAVKLARGRGRIHLGDAAEIAFSATLNVSPWGGAISTGRKFRLLTGAMLMTNGGDITIGDNCNVNPYSVLYGTGGLSIGDNVSIAAHCVIVPFNHNIADPSKPIREQGDTRRGIIIEDDVWIGAHVTVLDGSTIRRGCVIGAGAVVRGDTESFGVYVGAPARLVRSRLPS